MQKVRGRRELGKRLQELSGRLLRSVRKNDAVKEGQDGGGNTKYSAVQGSTQAQVKTIMTMALIFLITD